MIKIVIIFVRNLNKLLNQMKILFIQLLLFIVLAKDIVEIRAS